MVSMTFLLNLLWEPVPNHRRNPHTVGIEIGARLALDDAQLLLRLRQRRLALYQELNRQQGLIHQIEGSGSRCPSPPRGAAIPARRSGAASGV